MIIGNKQLALDKGGLVLDIVYCQLLIDYAAEFLE
jgi:hypothetical protein